MDVVPMSPRVRFKSFSESASESNSASAKAIAKFRQQHRARLQTEALNDTESKEHLVIFQENIRKKSRTTNLEEEKKRNIDYDESVLGKVNRNLFINPLDSLAVLSRDPHLIIFAPVVY